MVTGTYKVHVLNLQKFCIGLTQFNNGHWLAVDKESLLCTSEFSMLSLKMDISVFFFYICPVFDLQGYF